MIIGLLSDAHGNGAAFRRALYTMKPYNPERIYFLGDAIGYIPSISVLDHILALGCSIHCIGGNHEHMLLTGSIDEELDEIYQITNIKKMLTRAHLKMIETWAYSHTEFIAGSNVLMVHGSPEDPISGYIYPDTTLPPVGCEADVVFMGHTHRPFIRNNNTKLYVNVGSCGLPRDNSRTGSCVIFDTDTCEAKILRFDIHDCIKEILCQHPPVHDAVKNLFLRDISD